MNITREHLFKAFAAMGFVEGDLKDAMKNTPSGACDRLLTKATNLRNAIMELIHAIDTEAEQDND